VKRWFFAAAITLIAAAPAMAGPPYLTDDPAPTDTGHWEIYAFTTGEGRNSEVDDDTGFDLNFGPIKDVQLTATLPLTFSHDDLSGWRGGTGDVELGVKYRFVHDEKSGVSTAIFPRVILPTRARSPGERTQLLLPVWAEKDFKGGTAIFGGGGYEINPGQGTRDFWQAGLALTQDLSKGLSIGAEITRQGPDTIGRTPQTRAGLGTIIHLSGPASLLVSGGPTWADHHTFYRFYAALGLDF
jgi:hypothetical protein